jgi:hypothetical protein
MALENGVPESPLTTARPQVEMSFRRSRSPGRSTTTYRQLQYRVLWQESL